MSCARCGCGIFKTEDYISLNKVWHTNCFTCYQCNKHLNKDTAKIFQGELFCQYCYSCVIEKLFEVVSSPCVNKPCKVASTPSCSVSKSFLETLKEQCNPCQKKPGCCRRKDYCFPAEKHGCPPKNVHSCSCLPCSTLAKNEYCFVFPMPREVANYYNRSHMQSKNKNPITCCVQPRCPACSCRKCCSNEPAKCQIRTLQPQCCCNSCAPKCDPPPKNCCCCKPSPPSCGPSKGCCCCEPVNEDCIDPCSARCPPPSPCSPPYHQCCQRKCCKPKCSPIPWSSERCPPNCPPTTCCAQPKCPPPKCNCSPPKCCPAKMEGCCEQKPRCPPSKCSCSPPGCCPSPPKCCPPPKCYPAKMDRCCDQKARCKSPATCSCRTPKYCTCGNQNPCNCKISQIRAQCTVCCTRCNQKVYAAEKIQVSSGAYHTSCFTCSCCNKCLDVKNVYEGCGEIYCKQCYNHFFGIQYYGFGALNS